jgi:HEAT repeat protein
MKQQIQSALADFKNDDPIKIWEAAKTLVRLQANEATISLIDMARASGLPSRRCAAIWALGFLRAYSATELLLKLLDDNTESPEVRAQAAESLGYLGDSDKAADIRPFVVKGLDDPNRDVAYWCAFALRTVGDISVVPALQKLTASRAATSNRESLAMEAKEAIEQILLREQSPPDKHGRNEKTQPSGSARRQSSGRRRRG